MTLTPEAQRIAIAEACGYTHVHKDRHGYLVGEGKIDHYGIPDYLNDLNAMREAEKVLRDKIVYVLILRQVLTREENDSQALDCYEIFNVAHATAAQRAEAFLRTLGLWKVDACLQREISTTANT